MTIDKQKLALDPLYYELWMFNETDKHLISLQSENNKVIENNVYLESFLLHTRNIVDFLEDRKYDNDIRCSDFGIERINVNLPSNNTIKEINLWLLHNTKARMEEKEKPQWKYLIIRKEVNKCFGEFLNQISRDCFPSKRGKNKSDFEDLF